jgi:hypothetical protein
MELSETDGDTKDIFGGVGFSCNFDPTGVSFPFMEDGKLRPSLDELNTFVPMEFREDFWE